MTDTSPDQMSSIAQKLRAEFDEQFTRQSATELVELEEFVIMCVGTSRFALRLRDSGNLVRCPRVTPFPSANPAVVGLVGVQGSLVVVYDAGILLGTAPVRSAPGWLLVRRHDRTSGLLFDACEGYRAVPSKDVVSSDEPSGTNKPTKVFLDNGRAITVVEYGQLDLSQQGAAAL